jgi:hypothetical protein
MTFHLDKVSICSDSTNRVPFLRSSIASNWRQFLTVVAWGRCILTAYTSDHRYTIRLNPNFYFPPNVSPNGILRLRADIWYRSSLQEPARSYALHRTVRLSLKGREAYSLKAETYYTPRAIHIYCVNEQCRLFIPKSCVEDNYLYDATMIEFIAIAGAATSTTAGSMS